MHTQFNQRNALIGKGEGKNGNSRPAALRRVVGAAVFAVASFLSVQNHSSNAVSDNSTAIGARQSTVQKADVIEDIIEIILTIVNPPADPKP